MCLVVFLARPSLLTAVIGKLSTSLDTTRLTVNQISNRKNASEKLHIKILDLKCEQEGFSTAKVEKICEEINSLFSHLDQKLSIEADESVAVENKVSY